MPEPFGRFFEGSYDNEGEVVGLDPQDASTEEGMQALLDFVATGLNLNATSITLSRQQIVPSE